MQPKVDLNLCIGCGTCVALCPEVFQMGEDGKAHVIEGVDYEKNAECSKQGKESCPVQAIS